MFLRSINEPATNISGIGTAAVPRLARLGITKACDLLTHYPRDWEDRRKPNALVNYNKGTVWSLVKVIGIETFGYGNMKALKIYIEDETAQAALLFFNLNKRMWLKDKYEKGMKFRVWGKFYYKKGGLQSSSFEIEEEEENRSFGKIMPVYPLTEGVTRKMMQNYISRALSQYSDGIENELPGCLIEKYNLFSKKEAVNKIHFPASYEELKKAQKTLIYEELFYLEVIVGRRAIERKRKKTLSQRRGGAGNAENEINKNNISQLQMNLLEKLPFELTRGQIGAVNEINIDMNSNIPMARLLQGDVGSGKTLVSFLAALKAIENGGQAAIMAPTELLARQHAENAARLLEPLGVNAAFLTGNIKAAGRKELLKNLKAGGADIVIGTHALFSKDVEYKKLKLVVIDEQHRFGVTQRALIMSKGENPHLLMMSATPIPRTLALTVFGDMDVSVIRDMPPGRKPVKTHLAKQSNEQKVYDYVKKELEGGRQAYFVYPLIEEGENSPDIKDAVYMADRLSKEIFPKYKTALIHSKLTEDEKQKTMENFRKGKIQILAATSVVEVGVDVPNATCMVIEHAERFGLSALHQLRGRVGRGTEQSYCFLVYSDSLTEDGKARLKVMLENSCGFAIAEEDLKLRGPGQIAGEEQSGFLKLGIANPVRDIEQLEIARADAFAILENDPDLSHAGNIVIARVLEEAPPFGEVAF